MAVSPRAECRLDDDLMRRIEAIRPNGEIAIDTSAVASVVEAVVQSLSGDMSVADLKLYHELELLARYIQSAKREIAAVRPQDISARIPAAADELDAVVQHTAEATGTILDNAERIEKAAPSMAPETRGLVADGVTRIYEACNFQDIVGQRIGKVVKTLKYIEQKIDALLATFGDSMEVAGAPPLASEDDNGGLMHGPQLPEAANDQADIDAILAGLERQ